MSLLPFILCPLSPPSPYPLLIETSPASRLPYPPAASTLGSSASVNNNHNLWMIITPTLHSIYNNFPTIIIIIPIPLHISPLIYFSLTSSGVWSAGYCLLPIGARGVSWRNPPSSSSSFRKLSTFPTPIVFFNSISYLPSPCSFSPFSFFSNYAGWAEDYIDHACNLSAPTSYTTYHFSSPTSKTVYTINHLTLPFSIH